AEPKDWRFWKPSPQSGEPHQVYEDAPHTRCHSGARPKRSEGREPGIHNPRSVVMDSGLAACAAPRNDGILDERIPSDDRRQSYIGCAMPNPLSDFWDFLIGN